VRLSLFSKCGILYFIECGTQSLISIAILKELLNNSRFARAAGNMYAP
jgi:hypothetical protein